MIKRIESRENSIIKQCIRLASKKHRDKEGLYLIEGPNLVEEAMKNGADIRAILMSEGFDAEESFNGEGFDAEQSCEGADIYLLGDRLFSKVSLTETPQGIMAIVAKPKHDNEDALAKALTERGEDANVLVLDKVQDPGNIGTMIRTADAAGYGAVILIKGSGDCYSPKVVRSAAGSLFRVPIIYVDTYEELEGLLRKLGKKIVATGFDTDKFYYDIDMTRNIALVIGNEGNGISKQLFEMADEIVKIPMHGNIESLNAAVAAGILMYEAVR